MRRSIRVYLSGVFLVLASSTLAAAEHEAELQSAWVEFMRGLSSAQQALNDPALYPQSSTERELAEGYRYMLGHLGRMIEMEMRQDPEYPEFFRSMDMLRKWTAENPDAMYLKAPIKASAYYRVTGKAENTTEWRTSERVSGTKAPRIVIFQTITSVPGNTGALAEMRECRNQTLDSIRSFDLAVDGEGRFEILVGPKRPDDYKGAFLQSRKEMSCASTGKTALAEARQLSVREVFSDWENEVPLDLTITALDTAGKSRAPIDADFMAEKLMKIASELPNQVRFWQLLQEQVLEMTGDYNGDGRRNLPVNDINPPALPFTAGGVAGAGQLYAAGIFDLPEDTALVIKTTAPVAPHYVGFQLSNAWFEGPDQQNYVSSLTAAQLPVAKDGARYYIISKDDPGVRGWVDTTGYSFGSFTMRFSFKDVPKGDDVPTAEARLVPYSELASVLPDSLEKVSVQERQREIAVRQDAIKRRWRNY